MKTVEITKVVSKNFFMDIVARFQNIVGLNITGYEKMVQKGIDQIKKELEENKIKVSWYRYEISQLTNGAIAILFYGEKK